MSKKNIFSTWTFNLTQINQCWHFFWNFWKSRKCRRKKFQRFQSRKTAKINSFSQKINFFTRKFSSEHLEYTFNNLVEITSPKKNKRFSAAKSRKSRNLKRIEKWKSDREKKFPWNRSPGHIEYTSNTPDDIFSPGVIVFTPKFTIDKKCGFSLKLVCQKTFLSIRGMRFYQPCRKKSHRSVDFFSDKFRKQWRKKIFQKVFFLENVSLDTSNAVLETLSENYSKIWKLFSQIPKLLNRNINFRQKRSFDYTVQSDTYNSVLTNLSIFFLRKLRKKIASTSRIDEIL